MKLKGHKNIKANPSYDAAHNTT